MSEPIKPTAAQTLGTADPYKAESGVWQHPALLQEAIECERCNGDPLWIAITYHAKMTHWLEERAQSDKPARTPSNEAIDYAHSQNVKEAHWRELLDALKTMYGETEGLDHSPVDGWRALSYIFGDEVDEITGIGPNDDLLRKLGLTQEPNTGPQSAQGVE